MEIRTGTKSESTLELLKKGLDASAARSKVMANNIANINTKGYKRFYVSFEDSFTKEKKKLELDKTNQTHIGEINKEGTVKINQDTSTSMRADGNNVDIDNEMSNQAANTLMYNALITRINGKLALERYIIKDGRG